MSNFHRSVCNRWKQIENYFRSSAAARQSIPEQATALRTHQTLEHKQKLNQDFLKVELTR